MPCGTIKNRKKAGTSPELKADYETYCPERREIFRWVLESIGIAAGLNLLFYRSAAASVLWLPFAWFWIRRRKKQAALKRKQELYYHFRDLTAAMQFAVCAGYSLENAVREAYRDLRQTYGEKDVLVRELKFMKNQIAPQHPGGAAVYGSGGAQRSGGYPDVCQCADDFQANRREYGGGVEKYVEDSQRENRYGTGNCQQYRIQKIRTDDYECDSAGNYPVYSDFFSGIHGCTVR